MGAVEETRAMSFTASIQRKKYTGRVEAGFYFDGDDDYTVPQQGQGKQEADRDANPAVKSLQTRNTNQEKR